MYKLDKKYLQMNYTLMCIYKISELEFELELELESLGRLIWAIMHMTEYNKNIPCNVSRLHLYMLIAGMK